MEEKQQKKDEMVKARERGKGKNYHFPKKKSYPFFWLKKSTISSKASQSEFSGDIQGELVNVTNQPVLLGKPAVLTFKGNFPHQKVEGVQGEIIVDRTKELPIDKVDVSVKQFPVENQKFSSSESLKLELAKANGSSRLNVLIEDQKVNVALKNKFAQTVYNIDAPKKNVKEIVTNVVNGIKVINLDATAQGKNWGSLDWDIDSNFGKELASGVKREVKNKVEAAKRKVENHVKSKIDTQKQKLEAKFGKIKGEIDKIVKSKEAEVNAAKNKIESQAKAKQKKTTAPAKKAGKKALDKLKKKFKFKL